MLNLLFFRHYLKGITLLELKLRDPLTYITEHGGRAILAGHAVLGLQWLAMQSELAK